MVTPTHSSSPAPSMKPERILSLHGYDRALVSLLSDSERVALRGAGLAWLLACLMLGIAGGYAAWLIRPTLSALVLGGLGVGVLTLNLLRVVTAGGGCQPGNDLQAAEALCRRYRPSLVPALLFVVLAAVLSQPAQIAFWPTLDAEVDEHRQELIEQHAEVVPVAAAGDDYYRRQLEAAPFPVLRLKLIWQDPKRALRFTAILCLLVMVPAFWSQVISIRGLRAYQWQRLRRYHQARVALDDETHELVTPMLSAWPSYQALPPLPLHRPHASGPQLTRVEP